MAFGNIEVKIANQLRPCVFILREIDKCRGLFHGWYEVGGSTRDVIALVEDVNGDMHKISPKYITFIDNKVEQIFKEGCYENPNKEEKR